MGRKVRIGIDVGGTFTDAVVIDNETYEIIAKDKIKTTHHSEESVAKGIIDIISKIIRENNIMPEDVVFIAHGTTQATNALLEGDVAKVGILGMGKGLEGERAKSETRVGDIELSNDKYIHTYHRYLDSGDKSCEKVCENIENLVNEGAEVIVASESYSIDNPENEQYIIEKAMEKGLYATGGYEISQLYGLKARTRTAVVNGALIPKMMETANMTEQSVKKAKIEKPLMIMRCDGGVMTVNEVKKRPILTMLSGLAAGVAGALMYEKISDGIFLEVGGTSVDISVIKNGKVMIRNAEIGGHKLYMKSLDVRTLGVAGGSMVRVENGKIIDVGPRSAHIADLEYEIFADEEKIDNPKLKFISPRKEDKANYVSIECGENQFALTLAGAANILGYVPKGDYAEGNKISGQKAWEVLATELKVNVEEAAREAMDVAVEKIKKVVESLIEEYELSMDAITLVGGGGSASIVTEYLGEKLNVRYKIAKNAPYISTIGVALALVREQIERSIVNPTEIDLKKIREDVIEAVVKSGAEQSTVEVAIEVDNKRNIVTAIATGATELRTKQLGEKKNEAELIDILSDYTKVGKEKINKVAKNDYWNIFEINEQKCIFFGLIKKKKNRSIIMDNEGVIKLQKEKSKVLFDEKSSFISRFVDFIDENTIFSDAGAKIPKVFLMIKHKLVDLSGVITKDQLLSLVELEFETVESNDNIIALVSQE